MCSSRYATSRDGRPEDQADRQHSGIGLNEELNQHHLNSGFCLSTVSTVCTRLWAPEVGSPEAAAGCRAGRGHPAGSGTSRRDYRRRAGSRCWPQSSARVVRASPHLGGIAVDHLVTGQGGFRPENARAPPGAPDPRPLAFTHWCADFGERAGYLPHGSAEIRTSVNRCGKSSKRAGGCQHACLS